MDSIDEAFAAHDQPRPLEVRRARKLEQIPQADRALPLRDVARADLPARARGGGRAAGRDPAPRRGRDRAAARPLRRHLPIRRARPRPPDLRRQGPSGAGADRARPRPVRAGLHQHLPELSTEIAHRQSAPADGPSHPVALERDSKLANLLGTTDLEVNSFHHQGIDRVGDGLVVTGVAPDGTIEAVEDPRRPFLIGVQWHAETLVHRPCEESLFRSFVEACRRDSREPERGSAREVPRPAVPPAAGRTG